MDDGRPRRLLQRRAATLFTQSGQMDSRRVQRLAIGSSVAGDVDAGSGQRDRDRLRSLSTSGLSMSTILRPSGRFSGLIALGRGDRTSSSSWVGSSGD